VDTDLMVATSEQARGPVETDLVNRLRREGRHGGLPLRRTNSSHEASRHGGLRRRRVDGRVVDGDSAVKGGAAHRPPPTIGIARVGNEGRHGGVPLRRKTSHDQEGRHRGLPLRTTISLDTAGRHGGLPLRTIILGSADEGRRGGLPSIHAPCRYRLAARRRYSGTSR
jgi:hypothetical protein